jgi:hypothetical protein
LTALYVDEETISLYFYWSTPMFVFIIVEQNNNRFDESEKG